MTRVGTLRAECEGCKRYTDVRETLMPGGYETLDLCAECRMDVHEMMRPEIEE